LTEYLNMQSRLGKTSVGNTLLVLSQKPDATYIADYDDWQKKGRSIRKGEKGMLVLEADGEYAREDGSMGVSFKAKSVFDVSQTSGQQLRERTQSPVKTLLRALMTDTPVPVKLSDNVSKDIGAIYSREDKTVYVARGLDGNSLFKLIACELAHAETEGNDPQRVGFVSSCVANIVCKRYGIDVPEYDQIPESITGLSVLDKRSILGKIRETACDMSERIDKNLYAERQQQHSRDNQQR
jgi:N-terminal domain of anti-restriction factor ArdC